MNRFLLIATLPLALNACGGGGNWEVTDQPLQGMIGGASWTFRSGETDSFLSDETDFFASLYSEDYEACGYSWPEGAKMLASVPLEPGEYDFGWSRNVTFVTGPGENLISLDGGIVIDEVTATTVSGGMVAEFDNDNYVDGNFTLTICEEEDF